MTHEAHFLLEPETTPNKFCLFFAGAFGTYAGDAEIDKALKEQFGEKSVFTQNSIISFDHPQKDRFFAMAQMIEKRVRSKQAVTLVGHSFGVNELVRTLEVLEKTNSEAFKQEIIPNLDIILIGPCGFIEHLTKIPRLLRTIEVARTQAPIPLIMRNELQGVESITYLPISDIEPDEMAQILHLAYPDRSQLVNQYVVSSSLEGDGFIDTLPTERQQSIKNMKEKGGGLTLQEIDQRITIAIVAKNWPVFRNLLKRRGAVLVKEIHLAYDGKNNQKSPPSRRLEAESTNFKELLITIAQALLDMTTLIAESLHSKPYKKMKQLMEQEGVNIKFVVPQLDVLVKLTEIRQFLGEKELDTLVAMITSATHASSGFRSKGLAKAIKSLSVQTPEE